MEELKNGEYVRLNNGKIFVLTIPNLSTVQFTIDGMIKHSPNIIDLIEVGDYVNGNKINCFEIFNNISGEQCLNINYIYTNSLIIPVKDIKSIVTKEQFKSMEYKVGD